MKKYNLKTNLGNEISTIIENDELIYGVTTIMIGLQSTYHEKCKEGKLEEYTFHPLTNEKMDIIALNDEKLYDNAIMLVPLHIQAHYILALKYDLKFKQVVAPYFYGKDEEKIRDNVETQFRRSIIAVIKNEDKYLCVDAKKRICKSFVMGGIENNETPEEAMVREVLEETGYSCKPLYTSKIILHNHFYAGYKGVNRYAHLYVVFGELISNEKQELSNEEKEKQTPLWLTKEELKSFLTVNNNIYVYNNLLDKDKAFEEVGIMINSNELNCKMRSEVNSNNTHKV